MCLVLAPGAVEVTVTHPASEDAAAGVSAPECVLWTVLIPASVVLIITPGLVAVVPAVVVTVTHPLGQDAAGGGLALHQLRQLDSCDSLTAGGLALHQLH